MTRFLKTLGLWLSIPIGLLAIAAWFAEVEAVWIPRLIISMFAGGALLLLVVVLSQLGYPPKEPVKTPALIVIGVTVVMSGPLKEIPLVLGMILGVLLFWWMLERTRMILRVPRVAGGVLLEQQLAKQSLRLVSAGCFCIKISTLFLQLTS